MTATLQDAIAAVRHGETERAQLLAAEVIQDNPDDANAWYLLSQLVDSDARRAVYLNKTLALDPTHERARAELGALPAAALLEPEPMAAFQERVDEAPVLAEPDAVPEWLRPLSPEPAPAAAVAPPVYDPAPAQPAAPAPARPRPRTPPPPPPRQGGNSALTALLVLLALLTIAVLAILAYLLLF